MKVNLKSLMLIFLLLTTVFAFAQSTISGKVVDAETREGLPGVNILVKGTTNGTVTDVNGNFSLQASGKGVLTISFIGYNTSELSFSPSKNTLGTISLAPDAESLDEVVIIGSGLIDIVKDRQTPIAVSTIPTIVIQDKSGNQEFPEILKNTPSVQVVGQAGGYGDARINVRGFKQDNTAYLLNGQPINGMEDGKVYWSNWSGMNDIANTVQIQRGLGSSKLAISSVGGTVNIITKATEKKQGGFARTTFGNDAYMKYTVGYNTGMMENGLGVSALLTHWQGDGYNDGTKGQGQNYFISLGYKPSENHLFNFLVTGAPQWHNQNYRKTISTYLEHGRKYNTNWGYLNNEYKSERTNYYHKPVVNLNWDWNLSGKSTLSTVLYASWGRGGGTGNLGSAERFDNGLIDFTSTYRNNLLVDDGNGNNYAGYRRGYMIRSSVNNHQWFGGITNFEHKLNENWSFNVGADLRTYTGLHFRQITDFLGLDGYEDTAPGRVAGSNTILNAYKANPWKSLNNYANEQNRYAWDYDETINYGGVFGQIEYNSEYLSAYFQGAISSQTHERTDRYQYLAGNQVSEKVRNNGYNVKGGLNYKISSQHSTFVNAGYYSRQPYHDNIYLNFTNDVNPLTENEKVLGLEWGYQFKSSLFDANLNLYHTSWKDRVTTTSTADGVTGESTYFNNSGVNQLHQGVELDFKLRPTQIIHFNGFLSYGKWRYDDDVIKKVFNDDLELVEEEVVDVKGGEVGDSPQLQLGLGFIVRALNNKLSFDMDWKHNDRLYADVVTKNNLQLPAYSLFDAGLSYEEPIGDSKSLRLRFNVNNLFNEIYLAESSTAIPVTSSTDKTYQGIHVDNMVHFGFGRTWNISATLKF